MENNVWLEAKRFKLIGTNNFIPKNYADLLLHWQEIDHKMYAFLEKYGVLRRKIIKYQNNIFSASVRNYIDKHTGSKSYVKKLENNWRELIQLYDACEISYFDWLTQEPINYNMTKDEIIKIFRYRSKIQKKCDLQKF